MAQKSLVLETGSYSAKLVATRVPIFGFGVSEAKESILPSALDQKTRRAEQFKAARDLLPAKRITGTALSVVMPAERTLNRFLDMPFADRTKIDSVLGFELENHVPWAADELVHDYMIVEKRKDGSRLFVSVVNIKDIDEYKEALAQLNVDPRVLAHEATAAARLAELTAEPLAQRTALVNIGHRKTTVTIVENGTFAGCRIILHGSYDLTRALAERFSQATDMAHREKHGAHLFPAGEGQAVGRVQETADCLQEALRPLVRDLRQTFRAMGGVEQVCLFGGGAALGGIDKFLGRTLDKPVSLLFPSMLKISYGVEEDGLQFVPAIAAGYSSQRGSDALRINFRQGTFGYEGDFKAVRGRLIYLGILAVFMLVAFAAPQVMKYQAVLEEEEQLTAALAQLSEKILGEELDDFDDVLLRLEEVPSAEVWTVFPDLTAHEIYWEVADIMARIDGQPTGEMIAPPAEEKKEGEVGNSPMSGSVPGTSLPPLDGSVPPLGQPGAEGDTEGGAPLSVMGVHHVDMNDIRIDGASRTTVGEGVVEFTGNASSVATMELFLTRLGEHICFHNVQRTKQEMLKATAGKEGWWRFSVEFAVSCPKNAAQELGKNGAAARTGDGAEGGAGKETGTAPEKGAVDGRIAPPAGEPSATKEPAGKDDKGGKEPKGKVRSKEHPKDAREGREKGSGEEGDSRKKSLRERLKERKAARTERGDATSRGGPEATGPAVERGTTVPASATPARRLSAPMKRDMRTPQTILPSIPRDRIKNPGLIERN